jgi:SAM-dependent methyltransferase
MCLSPRLAASTRPHLSLTSDQLSVRERVLQRLHDGVYGTEEVACFCGATEGMPIAERDRYGLPVRTLLCWRCGLLRTSPRMTAEATRRFYEEDYRGLYSGPGDAEALFEQQADRGRGFLRLLQRLLPQIDTVYEVGCGAGGILSAFAEAGKRVAGCDLGGDHLAAGRRRGLDLVRGDAADLLRRRGEPADLVLLLHVAEHFLDLRAELAAVLELVRPGGLLLVEVPGVHSIPGVYRGDLLLYLQNAHTFHFTARTLGYVLGSLGLEVLLAEERALGLAMRPCGWSLPAGPGVPPPGEAMRVLRFLGELEARQTLGAAQQSS